MRTHDAAVDGRERLINEARRLFLERGFAEVSIQEIASAAEMTRAAPYYHFKDKEDLFVQVFLRELTQLTAELSSRLANASTLRDQLLTATRLAMESGQSHFGQLVNEFDRHVSIARRREIKAVNPPPTNEIRAVFEQAEARGDLTRLDARTAYTVFIAMLIGQMELVRTEREIQEVVGWERAAPAETLVDAFLHGV